MSNVHFTVKDILACVKNECMKTINDNAEYEYEVI